MDREFGFTWHDHRGSHGSWCRRKFYETHCNWCGQPVWYFECEHGSKVFFHDVPWWGGRWNPRCPADSNRSRSDQKLDTLLGPPKIPVTSIKSQAPKPTTREAKVEEKRLTKCDICSVPVRENRLAKHMRKAHSPHSKTTPAHYDRPTKVEEKRLTNCAVCGETEPQ